MVTTWPLSKRMVASGFPLARCRRLCIRAGPGRRDLHRLGFTFRFCQRLAGILGSLLSAVVHFVENLGNRVAKRLSGSSADGGAGGRRGVFRKTLRLDAAT